MKFDELKRNKGENLILKVRYRRVLRVQITDARHLIRIVPRSSDDTYRLADGGKCVIGYVDAVFEKKIRVVVM